jgi:subtilisin family serine protease
LRPVALLLLTSLIPAGVRGDLRVPVPGRVIDLGGDRRVVLPEGDPAIAHFVVKLAAPLDPAEEEELRRAGLSIATMLARDAAVVAGSRSAVESAAGVAWFSALAPEDKAPVSLLSGRGSLPRVSVLGHPGTTAAGLASQARAEGLAASGGRDSRFGARIEIEAGADRAALSRFLARDPVFAAFPAVRPRLANDRSVGTIQSGHALGPTPIFDHGLYGEGETIGILDTGLDVDACYFADPGVPFPVNTLIPRSGYGVAVDAAHRKIAAYDFLHPCGAFPPPCDVPGDPAAWDNQGHGTHVAGNAAGDDLAHPLIHDPGDGMAPGARLVIQDGGYSGPNDPCGDLPGLGCAPSGLEAILEEAYAQGARIHSDSWSDDFAGPPPQNSGYSMSARDVDDFVFRHPDFLPFFVAGNAGASGPRSIPSPGNGKNSVCVGSTRSSTTGSDDDLSDFSGVGPAADGRIKPDLVAPGFNVSASSDFSISTDNCGTAAGAGTSFAAPTAAGAAALVREYFVRGDYPSGAPDPVSSFTPSAALVKAALIASADSLPGRRLGVPVAAAPSSQQGFGRIDLARVLAFPESPFRLLVADRIAGRDASPGDARLDGSSRRAPLVRRPHAGARRRPRSLGRRSRHLGARQRGGRVRPGQQRGAGHDRGSRAGPLYAARRPAFRRSRAPCRIRPRRDRRHDFRCRVPPLRRSRERVARRRILAVRVGLRDPHRDVPRRQRGNEPFAGRRAGLDREPRFGRGGADAFSGDASRAFSRRLR